MKKIAVVEDDEYIGNMVEELLRGDGFDVLRAYSGSEALLLLGRVRPDLVLLDLMLPGASGEEVLESAKKLCPVIILSAKTDVGGKVKNLNAGASDYITKPFEPGELLARVRVQLRGGGKGGTLALGGIVLDTETYEVAAKGAPVRYSDGDFSVTMTKDGEIVFENAASALDEVSTGRLFDRFYTVENARGSTGLGLSIAKIFVEKMGGTIDASWSAGRLYIRIRI